MQTYQSMKDSGVAWLGQIPAEWTQLRGKFIYRNKKEINKGMVESQRLALTLKGVIERVDGDEIGLNPQSLESYQIFESNDLVFKLIDLENKKTSRVGLVHKRGIMSPAYIRLTAQTVVNAKYFYYFYYSLYLNYVFNNIAGEGVRANINPTELLEINVCMPGIETQERIADHLDKETVKIDNLIEKQERLLELLEEKRRATITHSVVLGVDPNASLKDTGVHWLGKVPAHWDTLKVGYAYRRKSEKNHPDEELLSVYRDYGVVPKSSRDDNHNVESADLSNYQMVEPDDLVTNKMKTWQGSIAVSNERGIVSPAYYTFRPVALNMLPQFMHFQLRSDRHIAFYKSISKGIRPGQWDLDIDQFKMMTIALPPLDEQRAIVRHILANEKKVDKTKALINREITLLAERRNSLISNVVTGKVKV